MATKYLKCGLTWKWILTLSTVVCGMVCLLTPLAFEVPIDDTYAFTASVYALCGGTMFSISFIPNVRPELYRPVPRMVIEFSVWILAASYSWLTARYWMRSAGAEGWILETVPLILMLISFASISAFALHRARELE